MDSRAGAPNSTHERRLIMGDIYVKCCRCKNKHWHSERKESAPDKYGMKSLICPRCGGHSYFKAEKPAQTHERQH